MAFYIIEKGPNGQRELCGSNIMERDTVKMAKDRLARMPLILIEEGWTVVVEDGWGRQVWGVDRS